MDRRTFIKSAGAAALLAPVLAQELLAAQHSSVVAVAEGADYPAITRKAINGAGGMKRYVKPGDTVVVKPNIGWDRSPEQAANSHPQKISSSARFAYRR